MIRTCISLALGGLLAVACQSEAPSTEAKASEGLSARELVNNPTTAADAEEETPAAVPVIAFEEETYDFGRVVAGEKVQHTYTFENTGKAPLLIQQATASCGCTVPEWPRDPIAPGESGKIAIEFNSQGRAGRQNKSITILANTQPNTTTLYLRGEVLDASEGPVRN